MEKKQLFCEICQSNHKKKIRVNNEFYICPVYNEAIDDKKNIIIKSVKSMWGLGTPEDLEFFINNYKKNL